MFPKSPVVGVVAGFLLLIASRPIFASDDGDDAGHRYAVISRRNVFHLNPPPSATLPEASKADLPKIRVSGLIRFGGKAWALLASPAKNSAEGPAYFKLAAGEQDRFLEVVAIHYEEETVDIINSGTPMTLALNDGQPAKNDSQPPASDPPLIPGARVRGPNPNLLPYPRMLPRPGTASISRPAPERPFQGAHGRALPNRFTESPDHQSIT